MKNRIKLIMLSCFIFYSAIILASPKEDILLPGIAPQFLKKASYLGSVEPNKKLSFFVWLNLRNKSELDQLVRDVYDQSSPRYHQFMTHHLYEEKFAPTHEVEQKIQRYFTSYGMQAKVTNHFISVTGTVDQIQKSLNCKLNYYRYNNEVVNANAQAPRLKYEIGQYISGITGLSNIPEFHSNDNVTKNDIKKYQNLNFIWRNFTPAALPTDISLQGFSGVNLQKTYNIANIPPVNGVKLDGSGQTLIIVDKCGTNGPDSILSDANQYFNENSIKPYIMNGPSKNFAITNPDGSKFTTCTNASEFSREIVLDIEASHTLAPGDNTVLVLGTDQKTELMQTISTLLANNYTIGGFSNAYVISNSWSGPETSRDNTLENSLETAAAAGISVNFSSGDCGDNTYPTQTKCSGDPHSPLSVDYPSSSEYVTAVGATAIFVNSNYQYAFETVWGAVSNDNGAYKYDGGTGGGISKLYGPVTWQNSISNYTAGGYGVINTFGSLRALPDVAMLGDPATGLLIIAQGQQVQDGGTSLACPLFSATLVMINQARSLLNKGTPIGQAAPYLYEHNQDLLTSKSLNLIVPPAVIISGATPPPAVTIQGTPAPASAFTINNKTFGWDSALTVEPEGQHWNDAVGVGSPNLPNFISTMANM